MLGGQRVNDLPTRERNVAMAFQFYALYPNLTVAENLAYPLHAERLGARAIREKVAETQVLQLDRVLGPPAEPARRGREARSPSAAASSATELLPVRRAPVAPRRAAARGDARRDQAGAPGPAAADGHRHPRPARGADHGRPDRGHARRRDRAGGHPARDLRQARQPVRRRLHRHAADEPDRRPSSRARRRRRVRFAVEGGQRLALAVDARCAVSPPGPRSRWASGRATSRSCTSRSMTGCPRSST